MSSIHTEPAAIAGTSVAPGAGAATREQRRRMFLSDADAELFEIVYSDRLHGGPIRRVRMLELGGGAIALRPGTSDPRVLTETFGRRYHMPPVRLPAAPLILDLGANIGTTAAHLAALYDGATVWCIEMDSENAEICQQNMENLGVRGRVINAAAWYENSRLAYGGRERWGYRVRGIWDLDHPGAEPLHGSVSGVSVRALVERMIGEGRPARGMVDYVKMDVEGSEAAIFESLDPSWLGMVGCVRVHVHEPTSVERIEHQIRYKGGMLAWRCPRHPASVVGVHRAWAEKLPRHPVDAQSVNPGPPPI